MSDKKDPDEMGKQEDASSGLENKEKSEDNKSMEVVLLDSDDENDGQSKTNETIINSEEIKDANTDVMVTNIDSESSIEEIGETKPKKRIVIVWQCLNPECTVAKKEMLQTATRCILSYYGMEYDTKKKRKVCASCQQIVLEQQKLLVNKLNNRESMFAEKLPVPKDLVLLEDSDEEPETDSSGESEFEIDASSSGSESSDGLGGTMEERLERIIGKTMEKLGFDFQVSAAATDLSGRLDDLKDDFEATDKMFTDLETEVDGLRKELYKNHEPKIKELPPLDLNKADQTKISTTSTSTSRTTPANGNKISATKSVTQVPRNNSDVSIIHKPNTPLPPHGTLEKPELKIGQEAYAMRQNILQVWRTGTVEEVIRKDQDVQYKLRFEGFHDGKKSVQSKVLPPQELAYTRPATVRLPVGTRCIGLFKEQQEMPGAYYSGIVAEPPKAINRNRYLVFFDDGYASYIPHHDIRVVCKSSTNVWDDIHPNSKDFIQKYLDQYPERPMVKLTTGQVVKTEWDGKWWITRVLQVDASLVRLVFDADKRTEWIYRGSTRLGPLFTEMEQQKLRRQQAAAEKEAGGAFTRRQTMPTKKKNAPYIEYKRDGADPECTDTSETPPTTASNDSDGAAPKRAVARKSTASRKHEYLPTTTTKWEYEGTVSSVDVKPVVKELFRTHICSVKCLSDPKFQYKELEQKAISPHLIPIVLGWERQVSKHKLGGRRKVFYLAPCGRRLRNLDEVHRYLRTTNSSMEIDFFNFDWWLHVFNEFKPAREFCTIKDLSYGKENVPVSCVNSIDRNYPEYLEYSTVRLPQKNVVINTAEEFLSCCDCTDDCLDKDKCSCWQMTIQQTACERDGQVDQDVGYVARRLPEIVLTGVYECNSRCKCAKTCLNRVVQHPMRMKLQVFKTEKRGWGIRTLHDIPQGAFICVYVGNVYTSEEANKQGQNFGDEYFAELDMIEVVERRKDGYESDVSDEGFEEDAGKKDNDSKKILDIGLRFTSEENSTEDESSDKDFQLMSHHSVPSSEDGTDRSSRRKGIDQVDGAGDTDDGSETDPQPTTRRGGFSATVGIAGPKSFQPENPSQKFISTRKQYGRGEDVYIMDAKSIGNIGRYLNHSCNPNVFVQNVFVDTHDLRFPWIAFFASTFVRAGGELCWDYNYEVGSIPGKELYCSCGSEYCRGKLL